LEQEVKEEKPVLEKPVDSEEEKKRRDGEVPEKGETVCDWAWTKLMS
jgi:hypothetical protein